jgi:hypothetical protein
VTVVVVVTVVAAGAAAVAGVIEGMAGTFSGPGYSNLAG